MSDTIKLERLSILPYTVNFPLANGGTQRYAWKGATQKARSIQEIPYEVYDWLRDETCAITRKSLVIVDNEEAQEELKEIMTEEELNFKPVAIDDIVTLFDKETSTKAFEKALGDYTNTQIEEIVAIMKDKRYAGKFDSATKRKIIAKRLNAPIDILFGEV